MLLCHFLNCPQGLDILQVLGYSTLINTNLMALSTKTVNQLADALTSEVVDYIFASDEWIQFMHEIVPDAVQEKLGDVDEDLKFELSMAIMDRIYIKGAN
jgi:hypothetical protein